MHYHVWTRQDVIDALKRTFPDQPLEPLLEVVDTYQQKNPENVQMAAIQLSEGNPQRLKNWIADAQIDYRDILNAYSIKFPQGDGRS